MSNNQGKGFTRVESLVLALILLVLTFVTFLNFRNSEIKARDVQRKHDIGQIVNALGAFFDEHGVYPASDEHGRIVACGCYEPLLPCDWTRDEGQREFCDTQNIVYMPKIPGDPKGSPPYCYTSDGLSYKLYAKLEGGRDPEANLKSECQGRIYNFGVSSSNTKP